MHGGLSSDVAIVTGAANGLGRAIAQRLAECGAKVIGVDVCLGPVVPGVAMMHGDVRIAAFRQWAFNQCENVYGTPPSIVIAAAGVADSYFATKMSSDVRAKIWDINFFAATDWMREGMKRWERRAPTHRDPFFTAIGIGSIISKGRARQSEYAATKAALAAWCKSANEEWSSRDGECRVLHPGWCDTPMVRAVEAANPGWLERDILPFTSTGKLIEPREVADEVVEMLCMGECPAEVYLDNGWIEKTGAA